MTAQTAAGSSTEEETHAGVGPVLAAETRCASKPVSAAWAGTAAASRLAQPAGALGGPRTPAAGRRGGAAPRLVRTGWAWPVAAGGGHSGARGCARLRLEFQYKQGPRLDRRVFSFLSAFAPSPLGARLWGRGSPAAGRSWDRVRVGAPVAPRRDGGSGLRGAPGLCGRYSGTEPAAQCSPALRGVPGGAGEAGNWEFPRLLLSCRGLLRSQQVRGWAPGTRGSADALLRLPLRCPAGSLIWRSC